MATLEEEAGEHAAALDAARRGLDATVATIAKALGGPPPRNRALIEDWLREVQGQVTRIQPLFARVQRAQADAARRAATECPGGRLPQAWYDVGTHAGRFRVSLNQWPRIEALVRVQLGARRRKLLPDARKDAMAVARDDLGDAVFDRLHRIINPLEQDAETAGQGAYADIGLPQSRFVALAHAAYRVGLAQGRTETTFLDVGCGVGLKLVAAAEFFDGVAGIEFDPGYAGRARAFLEAADLPRARVVEGDARSFAFYHSFDVVYLFRPIENAEAMAELEQRIGDAVRPGTLVIGPYKGLAARHGEIGLRPLAPGLYVSGLSHRETVALRRRAEHVGPAVRPPREALPTVWTPILTASHAMGFDLNREGPLDHV